MGEQQQHEERREEHGGGGGLNIGEQIGVWLREFVRGGPDRTVLCLEMAAEAGLALVPEKVELARQLRRENNRENAWFESEESPAAPNIVPGAGGVPAMPEGATSSPDGSLGLRAAPASAQSGAPRGVGTQKSEELPPSAADNASPPKAGGGAVFRRRPIGGGVASLLEEVRQREARVSDDTAAAAAAAAKIFSPEPQPSVVDEEAGEPEDAAPEDAATWPQGPEPGEGEDEWFMPDLPRLVLSRANPRRTAEVFGERQVWENRASGERVRGMHYWSGEFWEWKERSFRRVGKDAVWDRVCRFLDESKTQTANGDTVRFNPKTKDVTETINMLRSVLMLEDDVMPPAMWTGSEWMSTAGSLMFRNGLLNLATGRLEPHSPRLWVQGGVEYDWDPKAKCPVWERFLGEVFPGDEESQMCLEEAMGYSMTEDVQFQKGFLLVGESGRNGKGIVLGVLEGLVGSPGYVALDVHRWLATPYSSECLIGRRVGAFPDMRLKPPKMYGPNVDSGGLEHPSKEQMLKITAADGMTIGRKHVREDWLGRLFMKLWKVTNEIPNYNDNVLPTRDVKFHFGVSFLGREDTKLGEKLAAELSGIAVRCMRAYGRLLTRGRFVQPGSGEALAAEVRNASDPFRRWFDEEWVWDPAGGEVLFSVVENSFRAWCEENGERELERRLRKGPQLSQRINEVYGRKVIHPNRAPRCYLGLRRRSVGGWVA